MKIAWFAVAVALMSIFTASASQAAPDDGGAQVSAGVLGGPNWVTRARVEGSPGAGSVEYRSGLFFGGSSRLLYRMSPQLSVGAQAEVLFAKRGANLKLDGVDAGSTDMSYLDVPMLGYARVPLWGDMSVDILLGARLSILLNAARVGVNGDRLDESEYWDATDVGAIFGLGTSVLVTRKLSVAVSGRYDFGLTNIDDANGPSPGRRHRAFFLGVGVDWELWSSQ